MLVSQFIISNFNPEGATDPISPKTIKIIIHTQKVKLLSLSTVARIHHYQSLHLALNPKLHPSKKFARHGGTPHINYPLPFRGYFKRRPRAYIQAHRFTHRSRQDSYHPLSLPVPHRCQYPLSRQQPQTDTLVFSLRARSSFCSAFSILARYLSSSFRSDIPLSSLVLNVEPSFIFLSVRTTLTVSRMWEQASAIGPPALPNAAVQCRTGSLSLVAASTRPARQCLHPATGRSTWRRQFSNQRHRVCPAVVPPTFLVVSHGKHQQSNSSAASCSTLGSNWARTAAC